MLKVGAMTENPINSTKILNLKDKTMMMPIDSEIVPVCKMSNLLIFY